MEEQISMNQIKEFSKQYNSKIENKLMENAITKNGIDAVCIDKKVIQENKNVFQIELSQTKRYDQTGTRRCWIYAGINMIKRDIATNMNIDDMKLELSINYIAFFDKLEKSNMAYENIIHSDHTTIEYLLSEGILKNSVAEGGYWEEFVAIVDKYGIVLAQDMPETYDSKNSARLIQLYTEKVKKDIISLLELKNQKVDIKELRKQKKKYLQENYELLSKVLGEPVQRFSLEYQDKDGKYVQYKEMTPMEFKHKFLKIDLQEFVSIGNVPMYNKEYYQRYEKEYMGNVYQGSNIYFINLPIEELKELVIKQLKDKIPVWFACEVKKMRDIQSGILDTRLYHYEKILGLRRLNKRENLDFEDICLQHAMCFVGVNLEEGKIQRWKVEDSYGTKERMDGYYVMNDNYFEEFVMNIVIHKKYLSEQQIKLLRSRND